MVLRTLYNELPAALSLGVNSLRRARQTAVAIGRTGFDWVTGDRPAPPHLLRKMFERMGATYIKLGQFIASSPSIFPEEYVAAFQQCLDKTDPIGFSRMAKTLKKELGPRYLGEIFSEIDPEPIASASIAQVYAARLTSGEEVVIKIQRPGVKDILVTDLNFLYYSAALLETVVPRLKHASIAGIISEIRKTVLEECDFVKESKNIRIFADFLDKAGITRVVTPHVYAHASTRRVLTMQRLHGTPLTNRQQFLKSNAHPAQILVPAFEAWMESITGCEIFHGDLHAGNIMILEDGRVGFIDFGIVGRISQKTQKGVVSLINAMVTLNFTSMAESMLAIGMTREKVDVANLAKDLESLYLASESMEGQDLMADMDFLAEPDRFLLDLANVAKTHGIRFPREFTLLLKQFLYFDSYHDMLFDMEYLEMDNMEDIMALISKMDQNL